MSGPSLPLETSYWPAQRTSMLRDITLPGLLEEACATSPDGLALVHGVADPAARREWTYRELLEETRAAARALLTRFRPGDRLAIFAPNCAEWVIAQHAIAMAGMLVVAINPAYRDNELEYLLSQSEAVGMLYADEYRGVKLLEVIRKVQPRCPALKETISFSKWNELLASRDDSLELPPVHPLDPVHLQYTSGTTGFPKGALLHHKGLVNEAIFVGERAGMRPGDVCVNAMPMYHIGGGAVTELQTFGMRGTYVLLPGFDAALVLEMVEAYKGTHSLMVPTMLIDILEHPDCATRDLTSLRTVMSGAATVPVSLVHRVTKQLDCQVSILFGQTEMHGVISQSSIWDAADDQAGTVGRPLPELEVKVIDPDTGAIQDLGVEGEICCRGYQTMLGFYGLPEETSATIDADGWLHLGDLGVMDHRGYLQVTGRLKDVVIRGGLNIYPREIEDLLCSHPALLDTAVVGVPDDRWGEQIAAVLRVRPEVTLTGAELKEWCRARLAAHKAPAYWYVADSYPVTPSGKIQKFKLSEQIADGSLRELDPGGQVTATSATRLNRQTTSAQP